MAWDTWESCLRRIISGESILSGNTYAELSALAADLDDGTPLILENSTGGIYGFFVVVGGVAYLASSLDLSQYDGVAPFDFSEVVDTGNNVAWAWVLGTGIRANYTAGTTGLFMAVLDIPIFSIANPRRLSVQALANHGNPSGNPNNAMHFGVGAYSTASATLLVGGKYQNTTDIHRELLFGADTGVGMGVTAGGATLNEFLDNNLDDVIFYLDLVYCRGDSNRTQAVGGFYRYNDIPPSGIGGLSASSSSNFSAYFNSATRFCFTNKVDGTAAVNAETTLKKIWMVYA